MGSRCALWATRAGSSRQKRLENLAGAANARDGLSGHKHEKRRPGRVVGAASCWPKAVHLLRHSMIRPGRHSVIVGRCLCARMRYLCLLEVSRMENCSTGMGVAQEFLNPAFFMQRYGGEAALQDGWKRVKAGDTKTAGQASSGVWLGHECPVDACPAAGAALAAGPGKEQVTWVTCSARSCCRPCARRRHHRGSW